MQKSNSESYDEIARLRQELAEEAGKREKAEQLAHESQENARLSAQELENLKSKMSQHEEMWTPRAEAAEKKLGETEASFESVKKILNEICVLVFSKLGCSFYSHTQPILLMLVQYRLIIT